MPTYLDRARRDKRHQVRFDLTQESAQQARAWELFDQPPFPLHAFLTIE